MSQRKDSKMRTSRHIRKEIITSPQNLTAVREEDEDFPVADDPNLSPATPTQFKFKKPEVGDKTRNAKKPSNNFSQYPFIEKMLLTLTSMQIKINTFSPVLSYVIGCIINISMVILNSIGIPGLYVFDKTFCYTIAFMEFWYTFWTLPSCKSYELIREYGKLFIRPLVAVFGEDFNTETCSCECKCCKLGHTQSFEDKYLVPS